MIRQVRFSGIDAARREGVPLHRVSQGSGITLLRDDEIRAYAELGARQGIEVCLFVGRRAPWSGEAACALVPDGKVFGWRHLLVAPLSAAYDDVLRACDLGIRSVLAGDEGLITLIERGRRSGKLPADLVLKASAVLGIGNALGAEMLARAGVDTLNVAGDINRADNALANALAQTCTGRSGSKPGLNASVPRAMSLKRPRWVAVHQIAGTALLRTLSRPGRWCRFPYR